MFTTHMIYFVIPADGKGPSFGPVLDEKRAKEYATATNGYCVAVPCYLVPPLPAPTDTQEQT